MSWRSSRDGSWRTAGGGSGAGELAGTILQMLAAPAWIGPIVVAVVAAAFPIAVVLAAKDYP